MIPASAVGCWSPLQLLWWQMFTALVLYSEKIEAFLLYVLVTFLSYFCLISSIRIKRQVVVKMPVGELKWKERWAGNVFAFAHRMNSSDGITRNMFPQTQGRSTLIFHLSLSTRQIIHHSVNTPLKTMYDNKHNTRENHVQKREVLYQGLHIHFQKNPRAVKQFTIWWNETEQTSSNELN